jgi:tricorn protease
MSSTVFTRAALIALALPTIASAPAPSARAADPIKYARFPHIANSGQIAFMYQDDIWIAGEDGSNPRRLTNNVARDINPRFSPDGKSIAFSSNRMGNYDVYVVSTDGGDPKQLTWHTGDDNVLYWTPDGRSVVFTSARSQHPFGSPLYKVALDGTVPETLGMDFARSGMVKQDMTMVAYNRNMPSYWRKGYRGNAAGDIAVQDLRTGELKEISYTDVQKFREQASDVQPMWGADGKIYFSSERDGIFNIWRMNADGSAPQQVTRHRSGGVTFPAVSPDGKKLIYENEFDLWTIELPGGSPKRLTLRIDAEPKGNNIEFLTTDGRADGFDVAPSGDYLAVDFHGQIVVVPTEQNVGEKLAVAGTPFRERNETYSPDGKHIAYISDETGDEEIWVFDVATGARRKVTTQASIKTGLTWASNSGKFAFVGDNKVWEVDLGTARTTEVTGNPAGGFRLAEYSPDGNWLLYDRGDDDLNTEIFLYDIRAKKEYNLSQNPFADRSPTLTPDGRSVVFISNRDAGASQLFVVPLARLTDDPNDPLVRERTRRESTPRGGRGAEPADSGGAALLGAGGRGQPPGNPTRIDVDRIGRRAVQLTRGGDLGGGRGGGGGGGGFGGGAQNYFLSRDGRTIYFTAPDNGEPSLFSVGSDGRDRRKITTGAFANMTPTADRRFVFYSQAGRGGGPGDEGAPAGPQGPGSEIWRLTIANQRKDRIAFSFPVRVETRAEWNQIFEESWRVMKYRFYDPKMHGRDWDAIKARYKPMLAHVASNEDVYALANEMIGELSASHTGVSGPPSVQAPRGYATRFLGFELEPANGRYRISHIYKDGPADKEWVDLAVGDYVLAIDGTELKAGDNYWKVLSSTLNDYIPVRYAKTPAGESAKTVRLASITAQALNNIKYEQWVADSRAIVDKESAGQIAYLHIRSMDQPSLARFRNEINQYWNKKGIIVDIRYNGGGNIDQELLDILERKPYEYWNPRNGSRAAGRRPREAIDGPKILLTNHRSASDSEVTPMGFRQLGLGTIVGAPTSGQVIATGSYALINGGSIRTPGSLVVTYDNTKPNNYGINLENYGVAPDVWVKNTPMDEKKGFDRELRVAIDEAMKRIAKRPVSD